MPGDPRRVKEVRRPLTGTSTDTGTGTGSDSDSVYYARQTRTGYTEYDVGRRKVEIRFSYSRFST